MSLEKMDREANITRARRYALNELARGMAWAREPLVWIFILLGGGLVAAGVFFRSATEIFQDSGDLSDYAYAALGSLLWGFLGVYSLGALVPIMIGFAASVYSAAKKTDYYPTRFSKLDILYGGVVGIAAFSIYCLPALIIQELFF